MEIVLQGVPFMEVQVLRWKRLILLHEKRVRRTPKNQVKLCPPSVPPPEALHDVMEITVDAEIITKLIHQTIFLV